MFIELERSVGTGVEFGMCNCLGNVLIALNIADKVGCWDVELLGKHG